MKKRILSLILALSMVLSVLPLGAFAADPPELVMQGGRPVGTSGKGWSYDSSTQTLTLTDGTYDFSYTYPQNSNGAGAEPVACAVETQLRVEITGGTFEGEVINNDLGEISGGTFHEKVSNYNGMIIGGTFKSSVTSTGNGRILGGVFNSKTTPKPATDAYSITLDAAYPNAKITEVNGVPTEWEPYVVVTQWTKSQEVTIIADAEIFSLNGQPIGVGNCNSSYDGNKNTVKFTMPDDDVVLNRTAELEVVGGEIKSGETAKGSGRVLIGGKVEVTTKDKAQDFVGWTIAPEGIELRDDDGREVDLTSEWTFSFMMPDVSGGKLTLKANYQPFRTSLLMNADGTVNLEHVYSETYDGNETRKGDGWNVFNRGTLILEKWTYDFRYTAPTEKTGTLEAVTCGVQNKGGTIENGVFRNLVLNEVGGTITGGTFAAGLIEMPGMTRGSVTGGVFNGKTGLTNAHHVTVTDGSLLKVNGEDPLNADETTGTVTPGTAWDLYAYAGTTVTITADTEIFSLNGQPIAESSYGVDKKTVTFTMPDDDVVLNKAITSTDLVMGANGLPDCPDGTSGNSWRYRNGTLYLNDGTYDFSSTHPKGGGETTTTPVLCEIEIESGTNITGGIFENEVRNKGKISGGTFKSSVTNSAGGTISGGTFESDVTNDSSINGGTFAGSVTNSGYIKDGTFNGEVTNRNTIENGTFAGSVTNEGTIKNGSFEKKVTNSNTIMDGVFTYKVENGGNGKIFGGTFAGSVNNSYGGHIFGGVFNGHINVPGFGVYPITVDTASSKAEIKEVNGVSAVWEPYVVVTELTKNQKVIITADTEIFSLNGKPLSTDNCNSAHDGNENTVKFTMPNANVVLNGAITSTDLVMENGWPKDSNGGKNPCKGDGWEYIPNDPTNGDMLLLTGSNQTGGLFDFSTIGDGSAVECNVFVGKPTAITGGEFNGKVFNNSGILGGTFHGEVDNMGPGRIVNGTFHGAVENNGMIENGTFHDEVKNNGTINSGTFNGAVTNNGTVSESITGSGTLNGEPITKTPKPEPEPTPEPKPETKPETKPKPTTYTVTVIGGTIDGKTSVSAKENDTLTVVLDQNDIPDGMTFDMWSISSSKLSGDINVDYRAEAMTFQMPAEDVTIRAQYRSAEIIEDAAPSPLATAATIAVGGAAAGIVVWQGVSLGVDLYLANALPQGVPVPTDRRALALLLWETAGKPEVALPTLYGDIPAEEIELQKATRWAVQNGLMDAADKKDASFFDPDHYVTKMDVFGAWLRLKKLLGTIGTSPTQ